MIQGDTKAISSKMLYKFLTKIGIKPRHKDTPYGKLEYIDIDDGYIVRLIDKNNDEKYFCGYIAKHVSLIDAARILDSVPSERLGSAEIIV